MEEADVVLSSAINVITVLAEESNLVMLGSYLFFKIYILNFKKTELQRDVLSCSVPKWPSLGWSEARKFFHVSHRGAGHNTLLSQTHDRKLDWKCCSQD